MVTEKGPLTSSLKIFSNISEKDLASLYNYFPSKRLNTNELLIKAGTPLKSLFVVVTGKLEIIKEMNGKNLSIGVLERDAVFGSLLQDKENISPFTLIAKEMTSVIFIDDKLLLLVKPDTKIKLLSNLSFIQSQTNISLYEHACTLNQKIYNVFQTKKREYEELRETTSKSIELIERLKKIPSLPPYSYELSRMLMQEKISTDKVAEFIKTDPSLMATVLKTVNSPYYNLSQKVSDFHHALLLLGFNQIYQIVMDNSLNNVMPNKPEFNTLRDEAVIVANIAFEFALICGFEKPIILSTIGMLHVIGRAIKIILSSEKEFSRYINLYDDAIISELILREWKLPDIVYFAISYYKYPEFSLPNDIPHSILKIVSILHISRCCFDIMKGNTPTSSPFIDEYVKSLELNITIDEIVYKKILPTLRKKISTLPKALKEILEG